MYTYDIFLDDLSSVSRKILPIKRPNIPAPKANYEEHEILGIDGKLYESLGTYDDIVITIDFNYMTRRDDWSNKFRECKKFFLGKQKLQFSDDINYYYKIKKIDIGTNERTSKKIGKFPVEFTLDPYSYLTSGLKEYDLNQVVYNEYDISKPVYIIEGYGECHLVINGTDVTCIINEKLYIDTDLRLCYLQDRSLQNTSIDADYEDLYLKSGMNEINISENFNLKVIPNWRCI